ncbi:Tat (twin-arginine translocation) pathway signal sequence [Singulisphaera sp. GP187]|uniref:metallophosphoesterase family protein n=1 Tax=Singulisphaera sp. GP187 TaxID=1882752 RepID=UPI00092625D7|nr:metallophosphoesterase [Singulisphaera sp. GP187]SIN72866.1 Tat (twin-arginine translocation) pathway signal sequence [Singulisphaera sp. GP187]
MPLQILPATPPTPTSRELGSLDSPPSRREFLAGLAVGGASLLLGTPARSATAEDPTAWYALVSDIHIAADPSTQLRGQVMADNLRAVVSDILAADAAPRAVLIDGDLALQKGQSADYRTVVTLLDPLRKAKLPIYLGLGNHDDRTNFREVLQGVIPHESKVVDKQTETVDGPGLRFVVLDSLDQCNVTPGKLGSAQLDWLTAELDAQPEKPTLVFVHHNPVPVQPPPPSLLDTEAFLAILRPRRQVKGVVFGHTHVWNVRQEEGLYMINLPAVAYSFAPAQPLGWCRFRPEPGGGQLELRCIGGNREADQQRIALRWREA